jgi:DnaD/phage-associated family protein
MSTEKFTFFESFYDAICDLKQKEQLELFKAICEYAFYDNEDVKMSREPRMLWKTIKPNIKTNKKKSEGGNKGGRPKKEIKGYEDEETKNEENKNHRFSKKETLGYNLEKKDDKPISSKDKDMDMDKEKEMNKEMEVDMEKEMDILGFFEDEFKRPLSSIECQTIADWQSEYNDDLLKLALSEAVKNNARSLSYIEAILRNWKGSGIKTAIEAQEQIEKHKKQKMRNSKERKLPDWYKNDNETYEQASEEEIAEFQKLLEENNL